MESMTDVLSITGGPTEASGCTWQMIISSSLHLYLSNFPHSPEEMQIPSITPLVDSQGRKLSGEHTWQCVITQPGYQTGNPYLSVIHMQTINNQMLWQITWRKNTYKKFKPNEYKKQKYKNQIEQKKEPQNVTPNYTKETDWCDLLQWQLPRFKMLQNCLIFKTERTVTPFKHNSRILTETAEN